MDYVIRIYFGLHNLEVNLTHPDIFWIYLEKASGLCNPEANHTSEKRLLDYIIQKLILCIEKTFGL